MFVEPTPRVIEALKTAIKTIGLEKFLLEVKASKNDVEKWITGEEWVPLSAIIIACRINRSYGRSFNTLSKVIQDSVIVVEKPILKKKVLKDDVKKREIKITVQKERETEEIIRKRKELFNVLMIKSTLLLALMIPFILLGYFIGSMHNKTSANIGMVTGIIVWLFIIIAYTLITPIKKD